MSRLPRPIPVIEVFGPTIAGEGNIAGEHTMFLRLGYCDFRCSWCDSMHAVDPEQVKKNATWMAPGMISHEVRARDPHGQTPWVSISGGNPAMHATVDVVVEDLREMGYKVNVETQGSMWQDWLLRCHTVTVSPKPPSSGMTEREKPEVLARILKLDQAILKVVAFNVHDLNWAAGIASAYPDVPFYISIGTDPADTRDSLLDRYRAITEHVLGAASPLNRATFLPQLHVLLWGHGQGV